MNEMAHRLNIILIILILLHCVLTFPPQPIPEEYTTRSVRDIIARATLQATITFLVDYNLVNDTGQGYWQILLDFFGSDADSQELLFKAIKEITQYANEVQTTMTESALHHANGEQIEMAHNHIRSLRSQIKTHSNTATSPDVDILRSKIGQALHTIISFYSNTNWVELHGNIAYSDFGKDNIILIEIAEPGTTTCTDCGYTVEAYENGLCENNLDDNGKLTSGFKSGQDVDKILFYGADDTKGKCSHGTPDDTSRNISATGGIYKGRALASEAPHFHLHYDASVAATAAVKEFFIGQGGIITILGQTLYQEVIGVKRKSDPPKASLVLVIDDTGSMSNDIDEVKEVLTEKVTLLTDDSLPENFILVTFNDPVDDGTLFVTESKTEILSKIDNITVHGGGDCPEYAINGAIRGVAAALPNSLLWLFTDAIAKDHFDNNTLVTAVNNKNINMTIFLRTPFCNKTSRRKRAVGHKLRSKRSTSGFDVYGSVTARTGGNFFMGTVSEIGEKIGSLFQEHYPSSTAIVQFISIGSSAANTLSIFIDQSINLLKIEVKGSTTPSDISLQYLNGSSVDFTAASNTETTTSTSVILSLTSMIPGELILQRHVSTRLDVNITAQTNLDFEVTLLRYHSDGLLYRETSNPILGERYAVAVEVYNLNQNSSISNISLADSDGNVVLSTEAVGSINEFTAAFYGTMVINLETEYVIIEGTDSYGYAFKRTSIFSIRPVYVELVDDVLTRDLNINKAENISYTIISYSETNETYVVNVTDDKGYIMNPSHFVHTLEPNQTVTGTFQIMGTTASDIVTYVISLHRSSSDEIVQQIRRKLSISDINRPLCVLTSLNGSCPSSSYSSADCVKHKWTAEGEVQFNGVSLEKIQLLNAVTSTLLNYNNQSLSSTSGPLNFNVSADCCSPRLSVQAVDTDGFYSSCKVELATSYVRTFGVTIGLPETEDSIIPEEAVLPVALIGGSISAAVVMIVIITISIFIRIHVKKSVKSKVSNSFIDLPNQSDNNRPREFAFQTYNRPVPPRDHTSFRHD